MLERECTLAPRLEVSYSSADCLRLRCHFPRSLPRIIREPWKRVEEVRITWVEIRALPDLELVTAVEVLAPINKWGHGRQVYLDKRDKLHASRVNLVEIDLLLGSAPCR